VEQDVARSRLAAVVAAQLAQPFAPGAAADGWS